MAREVAPNLSYHYWYLGVRGLELEEEASPLVLVRGSEFNHEREIEMEDDEGHMGTATTKMSSYRTQATANPSFTDKCRYTEGWEDMWLLLLGSDDGTADHNIRKQAVTGAEGVFDYTFKVNTDNPQDPYFATLINGFAKSSDNLDAYKYEDALRGEFECSGSNEEAPTYTATFSTNYPKVNQRNPSRVIPAKTVFPKSADVRIYIAPALDEGEYVLGQPASAKQVSIDQYEYPCYLDWSFSVNNNLESVPCSGDEFGESTKVLGNREGEVSITVPWTERTRHLEKTFETGSEDGTTVTTENDVKTIWFVMKNGKIGNTSEQYTTIIKIPSVVVTSAYSEQSGTDAKQIELEGNIEENGQDSFIETVIRTDLANLHIDNTVGDPQGAYPTTSP